MKEQQLTARYKKELNKRLNNTRLNNIIFYSKQNIVYLKKASRQPLCLLFDDDTCAKYLIALHQYCKLSINSGLPKQFFFRIVFERHYPS